MCILFIYSGVSDEVSDYSLVLASNRDEFLERPSLNLAPWVEDAHVFGGRDLQEGCHEGTWMAVSPLRKKIGVLLNLPGRSKPNLKSRGRIVGDFVKCEKRSKDYIDSLKEYIKDTNDFLFVSIEFMGLKPEVQAYSNATNVFYPCTDKYLGFGNSLPTTPLKKVNAGTHQFKEICIRYNKISQKQQLIEELLKILKSKEKHLPDPELERRRPEMHEKLSSIFVNVPEGKFGSRTHTLMLITKSGHMDLIEITLQPPIDLENPNWLKTEYEFDLNGV